MTMTPTTDEMSALLPPLYTTLIEYTPFYPSNHLTLPTNFPDRHITSCYCLVISCPSEELRLRTNFPCA